MVFASPHSKEGRTGEGDVKVVDFENLLVIP